MDPQLIPDKVSQETGGGEIAVISEPHFEGDLTTGISDAFQELSGNLQGCEINVGTVYAGPTIQFKPRERHFDS